MFYFFNRKLFLRENPYAPAGYSSFVKQLMSDVCSPMRPNLPILKTKSDGITDFIKIGFKWVLASHNILCFVIDYYLYNLIIIQRLFLFYFSKIINTVNKHPLDCDHLIVFVIGGISGHEVHSICEATKNCGIRVSVGSTRMLSPYEALHLLVK